jgi:hypothetical protein
MDYMRKRNPAVLSARFALHGLSSPAQKGSHPAVCGERAGVVPVTMSFVSVTGESNSSKAFLQRLNNSEKPV